MTTSVCQHRGCRRLQPCPDHPVIAKAERSRLLGRTRHAYRTRIQPAVIARARGRCELRLDGCTIHATTAHRIDAGYHDDDLSKYQAACAHCHGVVDGGKQAYRCTEEPTASPTDRRNVDRGGRGDTAIRVRTPAQSTRGAYVSGADWGGRAA